MLVLSPSMRVKCKLLPVIQTVCCALPSWARLSRCIDPVRRESTIPRIPPAKLHDPSTALSEECHQRLLWSGGRKGVCGAHTIIPGGSPAQQWRSPSGPGRRTIVPWYPGRKNHTPPRHCTDQIQLQSREGRKPQDPCSRQCASPSVLDCPDDHSNAVSQSYRDVMLLFSVGLRDRRLTIPSLSRCLYALYNAS